MGSESDKKTNRPMPRQTRVTLGDLFTQELNQNPSAPSDGRKGKAVQHINLDTAKDGDFLESIYFCSMKNAAVSKAGKTFLNLTIVDKTGELVVRVFDDADRIGQVFMAGDFIYIQARVQTYQSNLQAIAKHIEKVSPDELNPEDFMPASHMNPDTMTASLRKIVGTIGDDHLRTLCEAMLDHPEIGALFAKAPAAKSMHHAYIHGLMEHTLSMALVADRICGHYKNLDRDMMLAGVLFHDIGKIYELKFDIGIDYSDPGKLLGHINIGVVIIEQLTEKIEGFPTEKKRLLQHLLLSHHGTHEFGAPVLPATVEASALHHIDNLDAKTNAFFNHAEKSPKDAVWTDRHFLLGTPVRKTAQADGPLYDFPLDENDD